MLAIRLTPIDVPKNSNNRAMNCGPLSVSRVFGIPYGKTQCDMINEATWASVVFDIATDRVSFVYRSVITRIKFLPSFVFGSDPIKYIAMYWRAYVEECSFRNDWCSVRVPLILAHVSHFATYFSKSECIWRQYACFRNLSYTLNVRRWNCNNGSWIKYKTRRRSCFGRTNCLAPSNFDTHINIPSKSNRNCKRLLPTIEAYCLHSLSVRCAYSMIYMWIGSPALVSMLFFSRNLRRSTSSSRNTRNVVGVSLESVSTSVTLRITTGSLIGSWSSHG